MVFFINNELLISTFVAKFMIKC